MAGISDSRVLTEVAKQALLDIARTEGHEYVPDDRVLQGYIKSLSPSENSFANRWQDCENQRGYIPSRDIRRK